MNDERLDDLIDRHLNGTLDDAAIAELEEGLLHSAADRRRFWKLAEVHSLLHEQMLAGSGSDNRMARSGMADRSKFLGQRTFVARKATIMSLAAGVFIGLFGSSIVWAMVGRLVPPATMTPLPLGDGGFEISHSLEFDGIPTKPRIWGGDFAAIVKDEAGVSPAEGRHMLQFLRGNNRLTPPDVRSSVAEIWQVVDLNDPHAKAVRLNGDQSAVIEVSARFNATAEASAERVAFGVSVLAFAGDVGELPELWRARREMALAVSDKEELADADQSSWQTLIAQVTVPIEANLLLVQLRATRKGPGKRPQEFAQHFVDDVVAGVRKGK